MNIFNKLGTDTVRYAVVVIAILIVASALIAVTNRFFAEFSSIAWFVARVGMGFGMYAICDNIFLREFKTIDEIRNGNVAYAIVLFGFALIIGFCAGAV